MTILSALCIFSGNLPETNSDAAAEALRAAGYEVFRLPPELKATLDVEGDDFIEIRREGEDNDDDIHALYRDAERIVSPFGGYADSFGVASPEPFLELTAPPDPTRQAASNDQELPF
jgi:hypothetical protein